MKAVDAVLGRTGWWRMLERRCGTALMLGPALVVLGAALQVLAEVAVADVSEALSSGLSALGLLGTMLGPVAVVLGLLGLHPRLREQAPRLTRSGVAFGTLGAVAALILLVVFGGALITEVEAGTAGDIFIRTVFQVFYAGFGLSLLLFGAASWGSLTMSRITGGLLVAAGALVFLPFTENLLAWFFEAPRAPAWLSAPALVFILVALFAVGYGLRARDTAQDVRPRA